MKKQLLSLATLCLSFISFSQTVGDTFIDNFITYEVTSVTPNTVQTIDYNMAGGTVVDIPAIVSNGGTSFSVTQIGIDSFFNNQLTSVTIPDSVLYIINFAFATNQLQSVTIPNGVISIGGNAFVNNQINSLTISNTVTAIGLAAFATNQLTSITIPESVNSLAASVFNNNPLNTVISERLTPPTITTGSGDTFGSNRSGIDLFIPSGTTGAYVTDPGALWTGFNSVTEAAAAQVGDTFVDNFITYEVTSLTPNTVEVIDYDMAGGTVVDIPEYIAYGLTNYNVTSIGTNAFGQKQLTSVTISNSITNIKAFAFNNNQFTSIVIPESVTNIGSLAFGVNVLNTIVVLGTTAPTITTGGGSDTFANSSRPNINLIIPNNTTSNYVTNSGALWTGFKMVYEVIPSTTSLKVANYDASNGASVSIPSTITTLTDVYSVTEIADAVFFDKGLTNVNLPNTLTSIGISAFNTNNLTDITIPDSVINIGSQAFVTNNLTTITLGNNVSIIGLGAFADNDLTSVTFPSSVTEIGPIAFIANPLTHVYTENLIPPTITTGTNDTFSITGDRSNIHLHIPSGTLGVYVTDPGALWTGFNPVTEDALSVSEFELANAIKVITTSDAIKIVASNSIQLQNYTIYTSSGAQVVSGNTHEITTSFLSDGVYILKLDFDKGTAVRKVIIN